LPAADDRLVDMAREGIDIAVRTGTLVADGLVARQIGEHSRALHAAPAYLQRYGTPARPDDLVQHRLIANSASPALNRWLFHVDGHPHELKVAGALRSDNTASGVLRRYLGMRKGRLQPLAVQQVQNDCVPRSVSAPRAAA